MEKQRWVNYNSHSLDVNGTRRVGKIESWTDTTYTDQDKPCKIKSVGAKWKHLWPEDPGKRWQVKSDREWKRREYLGGKVGWGHRRRGNAPSKKGYSVWKDLALWERWGGKGVWTGRRALLQLVKGLVGQANDLDFVLQASSHLGWFCVPPNEDHWQGLETLWAVPAEEALLACGGQGHGCC